MKYAWLLTVLCLAGSGAAFAEQTYNRIGLSAEAARMVENDHMEIRFAAHAGDPDPLRVAQTINRMMERAMAVVADQPGVDIRTGNYRIQPVYGASTSHGARKIERWTGYQQLKLGGSDQARLRTLAGQVQDHLVIEGMGFSVSPQRRERTEDALLEPVIAKLRDKAERVRKALGKSGYELVRLNIGPVGSPPPVTRMDGVMRAGALASAPTVAAGASRVQVSVSAEIELR